MNQIITTGQILRLALSEPHELTKPWEKSLAGRIKPGSKSSNDALAEAYGERSNFLFAVLEHRKFMQKISMDELLTWLLGGSLNLAVYGRCSGSTTIILGVQKLFAEVLAGNVTDAASATSYCEANGLKAGENELERITGLIEMMDFLQDVQLSDQKLLIQSTHAEYRAMKLEEQMRLDAVAETETVH